MDIVKAKMENWKNELEKITKEYNKSIIHHCEIVQKKTDNLISERENHE